MRRRAGFGVLTLMVLAACAGERAASDRLPDTGSGTGDAGASATPPRDSLVATAPGGVQLWFTLARPDSGAEGRCVDRTIEIRREGRRIPVPLLYTGAAPELVNDSTARARLSTHCRPGDVYLVDLRTGRPTREVR